MTNDLRRRDAVGIVAAGAVAAPFVAAQSASAAKAAPAGGLADALREALSGSDGRLAFLREGALVVDHDVPFPLDRDGYADHLGFHDGNWERVEIKLHDVDARQHGSTGIVSAYFIQRGKPKDAGFRLRAGYCTAVCANEGGRWRALALHLSPLSSQIVDASPG